MFRKKGALVFTSMSEAAAPARELASLFSYCIQRTDACSVNWLFLCIGSDRITGFLRIAIRCQLSPYCNRVFGMSTERWMTRCTPESTSWFRTSFPPPREALLVAIDASLGSRRHQDTSRSETGRSGRARGQEGLCRGRGYFYHRHCECIGQF